MRCEAWYDELGILCIAGSNRFDIASPRLDAALMQRPGQADIQLDLYLDYRENVALYPLFQRYFCGHRPPTLALWGDDDPFFLPAGASAFKRDNSEAIVEMISAGHFALETAVEQVAEEVHTFLSSLD